MPPPRFVRRSSTSELRRTSVFSAKDGIVSAEEGVMLGAGEEVVVDAGGGGDVAAIVDAGVADTRGGGAGRVVI